MVDPSWHFGAWQKLLVAFMLAMCRLCVLLSMTFVLADCYGSLLVLVITCVSFMHELGD